MNHCLDEGTLQAYLDGELSPEFMNGAAAHLAACAPCTKAARAAEGELALFSNAYAPAFAVSVPTETLRARLDEAIAEMNALPRQFVTTPASGRVRSFFASLVASLTTFTPRQATAFASFLVAVALAIVFFALMGSPDNSTSSRDIARNEGPSATEQPSASTTPAVQGVHRLTRNDTVAVQTTGDNVDTHTSASGGGDRAIFQKAGLNVRPQPSRPREGRGGEAEVVAAIAATKSETVIEDEKTYLRSIASLSSAIEAQEGAEGMTPTLRAEYERNLAVVNQAIVSSRVAARRNPQDTDAKEFLRAAYQNKVELLSAVADQAQLASSRD